MSNNKYIIDEDSLTGIADAVRNKLGNGEAITDEDAGYYPVTVKKLGFSQTADTAGYSGPGSGYADNTIYARPVSELVNICGIRPSYIKVTVTNSSGFKNNDIIFRYTNAGSPSSSMVASANFANYIAILPIPNDIDDCYIAYGAYYSTYSSQYTSRSTPPYDVVFLDSNQNEININEYSGNSFVVNTWGTTKTFLTGTSFEKIPYSIDDIQDRITNYLTSNVLQTFSFNGYYQSSSYQPYVNLSSIFSSRQDLLNRLYNVCVWGLPGTLLIGADGHPVSMRKEGVALPSNIVSGVGGWDVTDVPTAYNNDQIFRYHFKDPNLSGNVGDTQLAYIYVPSSVTNPFIIFCLDNTIGYSLNSSGNSKIIMYRSA